MIIRSGAKDRQLRAMPGIPNRWEFMPAHPTAAFTGRSVGRADALGIAAFYSGVSLIAKTGGTLPLEVRDTRANNQVVMGAQVAMRLRYRPNSEMVASVFWSTMLSHLVAAGNAYAMKLPASDELVEAPELWIVAPETVTPMRRDGQVAYRILLDGGEVVLPASQVLHVRDYALDGGVVGHSAVSLLRNALGISLAAQEYQARMFRQGATPKGVLSVDEVLEPEDAVTIRDQWQATYGGIENAGRIAVLDRGARFQSISQTNDQAQLVEQREFGATEIASILNIPPAMIGAKGASLTYQNAQQNDLHFLKFTLRPWLQYIEDALNADPDYFGMASAWVPRFNTDEIVRPDNTARAAWYSAGINDGWLSVNDVRTMEGMAPIEAEAAAAQQVFGYHLESGAVTLDDVRLQLGLQPWGDEIGSLTVPAYKAALAAAATDDSPNDDNDLPSGMMEPADTVGDGMEATND